MFESPLPKPTLKAPLLSNPTNIDRYKRISLLQQNIKYNGKRFVAFIPAFFLKMSQAHNICPGKPYLKGKPQYGWPPLLINWMNSFLY
jgi:hypothetical protein